LSHFVLINNQYSTTPCWLVPCWQLNADVVQWHKKSQNGDAAIGATVPLSSAVVHLQVPDLLQGIMDTKLQI